MYKRIPPRIIEIWEREGRPLKVGHRGAPINVPGNTLGAFAKALELGVDVIETDVRMSLDGHLVLAHDPVVRGTTKSYEVRLTTLPALKELDLGEGYRILTLPELIEWLEGRATLLIDVKEEGLEEQLVRTLWEMEVTDVIICGASRYSRELLRKLNPSLALSLTLSLEIRPYVLPRLAEGVDTDAVTWHCALWELELLQIFSRRGIFTFAWTVDETREMQRLLNLGIHGIITNRPDLLNTVMRVWGKK